MALTGALELAAASPSEARHGRNAAAIGFGVGAVPGAAIASSPYNGGCYGYYGDQGYYGYAYAPGYAYDSYAYEPGYAYVTPGLRVLRPLQQVRVLRRPQLGTPAQHQQFRDRVAALS
jgi:hypothetical protein